MFGESRFLFEAEKFQQIKKTLDKKEGLRYADFTDFQNMKSDDFANSNKIYSY